MTKNEREEAQELLMDELKANMFKIAGKKIPEE